jgi:hypothetical protein
MVTDVKVNNRAKPYYSQRHSRVSTVEIEGCSPANNPLINFDACNTDNSAHIQSEERSSQVRTASTGNIDAIDTAVIIYRELDTVYGVKNICWHIGELLMVATIGIIGLSMFAYHAVYSPFSF